MSHTQARISFEISLHWLSCQIGLSHTDEELVCWMTPSIKGLQCKKALSMADQLPAKALGKMLEFHSSAKQDLLTAMPMENCGFLVQESDGLDEAVKQGSWTRTQICWQIQNSTQLVTTTAGALRKVQKHFVLILITRQSLNFWCTQKIHGEGTICIEWNRMACGQVCLWRCPENMWEVLPISSFC